MKLSTVAFVEMLLAIKLVEVVVFAVILVVFKVLELRPELKVPLTALIALTLLKVLLLKLIVLEGPVMEGTERLVARVALIPFKLVKLVKLALLNEMFPLPDVIDCVDN